VLLGLIEIKIPSVRNSLVISSGIYISKIIKIHMFLYYYYYCCCCHYCCCCCCCCEPVTL